MKWAKKFTLKMKFKNQVIFLFLPIIIIAITVSGLLLYYYGIKQVNRNSDYLISNTTKQIANVIDDRLVIVFLQCNELKNASDVWRLINNFYTDEKKEYADILSVYKKLQEIYSNSSMIMDSIALANLEGMQIKIYNGMVYDKSSLQLKDYLVNNNHENYGYTWLNSHIDTVFPTKIPRDVISLVLKFKDSKKNDMGMILFNIKSESIRELLNDVEISENGYAFLLSQDSCLMPKEMNQTYGLSEEQLDSLRQELGKNGSMKVTTKSSGEKLTLYYNSLSVNNWIVVSVVPQSDLFNMTKDFKVVLLFIVIGAACVITLAGVFIADLIAKPIEKLSGQVKEFEENQNVNFEVQAGREINTLAEGMNHLKITVEELLNQVKEEQVQKSKLELMIMQAQIKPHFLYNTLTSVKHLIDMEDNNKASKMCTALIQFYKIGLSNGKEVITIGEEMEHVLNYLKIQRLRYHKDFDYSIEVEDRISNIKLPRMTLQPFVENAIYHGIKPKNNIGMILISGQQKEDKVVLTIYDDGAGMTIEERNKLEQVIMLGKSEEQQGNFGIYNVYRRLKLFFGNNVVIKYESSKDVYTQVQLEFTINKDDMG